MAWNAVTDVNDGQSFGGAAWQSAIDAVDQLQDALGADVPAVSTWSTPISAGITQGNGVVTAVYAQVGPIVVATFHFVLGSTSAVTGDVSLTLPVSSVGPVTGGGFFTLATRFTAHVTALSAPSTIATVRAVAANATDASQRILSASVPGTWVEGHQMQVTLVYLAA